MDDMHKYAPNLRYKEAGFSLISIVLMMLFLGAALAGLIALYEVQQEQERLARAELNKRGISDRLDRFFHENGRVPCPAATIGIDPDDPEFGAETNCVDDSVAAGTCSDSEGYCVYSEATPGGTTHRIRVGMLPFKALGLGAEDALDSYDNRLTYVADEKQALVTDTDGVLDLNEVPPGDPAYEDGDNAIFIRIVQLDEERYKAVGEAAGVTDFVTLPIGAVPALFFSHGKNARGAITAQGARHAAYNDCPAGDVSGPAGFAENDFENCDQDGRFTSLPYQEGTDAFDDDIVYTPRAYTNVWDEASRGQRSIANKAGERMGIGTADPQHHLHVFNGHVQIDGANARSARICTEEVYTDADGDGELDPLCFFPEALGGTGVECPEGFVLVGIQNSLPQCESILGRFTSGCGESPTTFVTGFNINPQGDITLNCGEAQN